MLRVLRCRMRRHCRLIRHVTLYALCRWLSASHYERFICYDAAETMPRAMLLPRSVTPRHTRAAPARVPLRRCRCYAMLLIQEMLRACRRCYA